MTHSSLRNRGSSPRSMRRGWGPNESNEEPDATHRPDDGLGRRRHGVGEGEVRRTRSTRSSRTTRQATGTTGVRRGRQDVRRRGERPGEVPRGVLRCAASRTSAARRTRRPRTTSQKALAADPKFHYAKVQLALYQFKADNNIDAAIASLQQAVLDAQFQNVPALVEPRAASRCSATDRRGPPTARTTWRLREEEPPARARHRRRVHARVQPALALLLRQAKKRAGAIRGKRRSQHRDQRSDGQARRRAAARARRARRSQAMQKNPSYAPIYNTAGLIQNELGKVNLAVQFFQKAAHARPDVLRSADELSRRSTSRSAGSSQPKARSARRS